MVPLLRQSCKRFGAKLAREDTLRVGFSMLTQRSDRNIAKTAFLAAVVTVVTAHMMIEILERYVDDGTDNASIVLSVLQTER